MGFLGGSVAQILFANAGDTSLIPWSGRSPEEGNGNPHQYSYLGNLMGREDCQATVDGVAKVSDTTY